MKYTVLLAVLAAVCLALVPSAQAQCGKHQVYTQCGSPCPPSCKNPSPTCATVCVAGCFCKPKYLRNDKGFCVKPIKCSGLIAKVKDFIG